MSSSLPSRLCSLDIARGLAALSIVFWHWQHFFYGAETRLPAEFDWHLIPAYTHMPWLYEHVGILSLYFFFSLSGFVFFWLYAESISQKQCSTYEFIVARVARLYPLHLLSLGLVAVLQTLYWHQSEQYFVFSLNDGYHFLLQIFLINAWGLQQGFSFNGPIWSVSSECLFYVCFFLLARLRCLQVISTLMVITFLILLRTYAGLILGQLQAYALVAGFESFMWGGLTYLFCQYFLRQTISKGLKNLLLGILSMVCLCFSVLLCFIPQSALHSTDYDLIARSLIPISLFTLVMWEMETKCKFSRWAWLGDITYSVYLLHFPLQLLCELIRKNNNLSITIYSSGWFMLLFFAVLIPLSYLSYRYFEAPLRQWLRSRYMT